MSRRKPYEGPKSPLEYGQRVKIRTRDGLETTGKVSFIGWMPFPGMWSFEVTDDVGQVWKTHGMQMQGANITRIEGIEEAPRIEQTEAGPQTVAPGTPARTIPTNGLRPKVAQKEGPLPLEMAEIEARQEKLF